MSQEYTWSENYFDQQIYTPALDFITRNGSPEEVHNLLIFFELQWEIDHTPPVVRANFHEGPGESKRLRIGGIARSLGVIEETALVGANQVDRTRCKYESHELRKGQSRNETRLAWNAPDDPDAVFDRGNHHSYWHVHDGPNRAPPNHPPPILEMDSTIECPRRCLDLFSRYLEWLERSSSE